MPKVDDGGTRVRLNLEVSQAVRDRLESLRDASGATSLTEVIRSALSAYALLLAHKEKGGKIVLVSQDGREVEVELLL